MDWIGGKFKATPEFVFVDDRTILFQGHRKLFIFGGQRKRDEYLNDFFSFNVDTDEVEVISTGTSSGTSPEEVLRTSEINFC